jgi:uncharacterized membrane protein
MKRENVIKELVLILITLLPIIYLIVKWNSLPEQMPIHFDMEGNPNGYGSRYVFIFMPVGLYLMMLVLPKIDPRKANYSLFENSYYNMRVGLSLFIGVIDSAIIYSISGKNSLTELLPVSLFFLFMFIGNYLGTVRPNYFVGIKVPWTLNSDEVWIRTHKLAGKLWFWGSLFAIFLYFIVKDLQMILIPLLVVLVIVPVVYSYIIYQKINKEN